MSDDLAFIDFFTALNNMTVAEVKELLKAQGLPVNGKKEDLFMRLLAYSPRPQGLGFTTKLTYTPEAIRSSVLNKIKNVLNPTHGKAINWERFPSELFT